jgi:hypothetical protein
MAYTLTEIAVPELEYDLRNNTAVGTRVLRLTPWSELDAAVADLGGGAISSGNILLVTQPAKFPGKPHLWLHKIKIRPFHDCVGDLDVDDLPEDPTGAELTLTYQTPAFETNEGNRPDLPDVPSDTFLTVVQQMSLEVVSEESTGLYWPAGLDGGLPFQLGTTSGHALPIDANISATIAVADIQVTWHRVKNPPRRAIKALQGTVNNSEFMGYAAEQVMFVGVQTQQQFQTDGSSLYQLTYQFNARVPKFKRYDGSTPISGTSPFLPAKIVEGGWNHFPRKGTLGSPTSPFWQKVYRRSGDLDSPQEDEDLLYLPTDFSSLFQPDPQA